MDQSEILRYPCSLALDGHSYASVFAPALLQAQAVVRVGGYNAGAPLGQRRASWFQWFEPLLVEGLHYIRTDLDGLTKTLDRLPDVGSLIAMGLRGQQMARSLFTQLSVDCYTLFMASSFASHQANALLAAAQTYNAAVRAIGTRQSCRRALRAK